MDRRGPQADGPAGLAQGKERARDRPGMAHVLAYNGGGSLWIASAVLWGMDRLAPQLIHNQ